VSANVYGRRVTYSATSRERVVPMRDLGAFSAQDLGYLDRFAQFISRSRRAIPVFPWVRGGQKRAATLRGSQFTPPGRTLMPRGSVRVALIWSGGPGNIAVSGSEGGARINSSGNNAWLLVDLPGTGRTHLSIQGQTLAWDVAYVDKVPGPPWLPSGTLSEAQRVVRATWLLGQGPPEWRSFAVTELAALADAGNFPAEQLWRGARSGELESEFGR
jgi:hypothetical protein